MQSTGTFVTVTVTVTASDCSPTDDVSTYTILPGPRLAY